MGLLLQLEEDMDDVVIYMARGDDEIDPFNHNLSPPQISSHFGPLTSSARLMDTLEMLLLLSVIGDTCADNDSFLDLAAIYACEAVELLAYHYGFVPPLLFLFTLSTKVPILEQTKFMHLLGLTLFHQNFFSLPIAGIAPSICQETCQSEIERWDLEESSCLPVHTIPQVSLFYQFNWFSL
jgi:hypothetical protein